jgi:hypothetical protein
MSVVVGVFVALAAIAVLAMTVLVLIAEWRGFPNILGGLPAEGRRRAIIGGASAMLYIVVCGAVLIASPWGQATWLVFFGSATVVLLAITGVLAVTGARGKR